ncbi:MAG: hypothetical protein IJW94_02900 [Oscillospiraceae bacterium]|nr:hypothetical protein [Oscillospiraceae bacterium]
MKSIKMLLVIVLALCMVFTLCACDKDTSGNDNSTPEDTGASNLINSTNTDASEKDDGKVSYTVRVEDTEGAPIAGAMVQLCKDACVPGVTDASGVASFQLAEDDYKVTMMTMPAGYTYVSDETEFHFNDSRDITITLKAAE